MRLYLIRHAQPDYPGGKRMCLGQKTDLPLSAAGFEQARQLSALLRTLPLHAVYTSPMLRAQQTAGYIAGDSLPLLSLPDLIELHGGEWDGLTFDEIHVRYPDYFRGVRPSCPPGGESDEQGLTRALSALQTICALNQDCAAVAHGAIIRALLCHLLHQPMSEKKNIPQDCAAVNILDFDEGVWTVRAINLSLEELRRHIHGA